MELHDARMITGEEFSALFGLKAERGKVAVVPEKVDGVELVVGWVGVD